MYRPSTYLLDEMRTMTAAAAMRLLNLCELAWMARNATGDAERSTLERMAREYGRATRSLCPTEGVSHGR